MSSLSVSKRHQDLEYNSSIRLKTEQLGAGHENALSNDGMPTRVSVSGECRRPSDTSCTWSFVPHTSITRSHPSSISTAPEPCTPPNHGIAEECRILDSDMIYMADRKDHMLKSPFSGFKSSPMTDMTPSKNWYHPHSMRTSSSNTSIPSTTDISMALRLDNEQKSEPTAPDFHDFSRSWSNADLTRSDPTPSPFQTYPYTTALPIHSASMNVPAPTSWQPICPQEGVDVATIMPSQTMVDISASSTLCDERLAEYDPQSPQQLGAWDADPFHGAKREMDQSTLDLHREVNISDHMLEYLPSSPYSQLEYVSNNNNRGLRKPKRSGTKYKSKTSNHLDPAPWKSNLSIPSTYPNAKFPCPTCNSKFQRVEHLRRHLQIHDDEGPKHVCPACSRGFGGRADNLREHFKTHLRDTQGSRNPSVPFEEFYRMIREYPEISQEQADKYVAKLESWRRQGGHLKSENGNGRSRARRSN
jgi:hypothetical protein